MSKESRFSVNKLRPLMGTAMIAITSVVLLGATSEARADSGPYYVSYPGYCNVKRLYVDVYGNLYGQEIGCRVSYGEPMAGVSNYDAVRISRVNWSTGTPCIETYWYDGTLSGVCSDGTSIQYEPTYYYDVRSKQAPGAGPGTARIAWKVETKQPDLEALKGLPSFSR